MFLLVPADSGCPGQNPDSHKMVEVVVVVAVAAAVSVLQIVEHYSITVR